MLFRHIDEGSQAMNTKTHWTSSGCLLALLVVLAGCAGETLQKEGMNLLAEGQVEEGLQKLKEATKAEPENLAFRSALVRNREVVVSSLLGSANNERSNGHAEVAQQIYERVLAIDPGNARAIAGLASLLMDQRHAVAIAKAGPLIKKGDYEAARALLKPVLLENPRQGQAQLLQSQIDEQVVREQLEAPVLQGKFKKAVSLQFRDANLKMVFEALARTSGINILLDKDVKADLKTSIFVKDVSVEDTIGLILLQSQLEKKVIGENTIFIYPNTPAKLKDYQDLKIRSFHLVSADPKQIQTMLKTLLKTKDIFIHEKTNSIVMRDTPEAIRIAEKMIADQDFQEPEVMLEVEILEVAHERISNLGLQFPNQLTLTQSNGSGASGALLLKDLGHLNTANILTSPALAMTLNLKLQDNDTNVLASPRIRAKNHEKAKIMIGDRVPVITNAVTPVSNGTSVVTGNVQYLDVGLKLEVEPDIHTDNEITIKVNMDVSSIIKEVQNSQSGTLAYQIGTRNASTVLRLKDGETQILAGLINSEEQMNASKVPLLGQLPIAGRLFSNRSGNAKKTEIVLSITPHIVGQPHVPGASEVEYWSGSETTMRSDLQSLRSVGAISLSGGAEPVMAPRPPVAPLINPGNNATPLAPAGVPGAAAPEEGAAVWPLTLSWQGPPAAKVGDRITVAVNAQATQAVSGIGFLVGYDPRVLKALDVVEGDFLKQAAPPPVLKKTIDPFSGQVLVSLLGAQVPGTESKGATGSGSIVSVQFEVIGSAPQSRISLSRISPVAANKGSLTASPPAPLALVVEP
jgi:general secretion pathway protein D